MIKIKRAYEKVSSTDGLRILVDRLWPRGISKERLKLYEWNKDIAPSTKLRKWFDHDPKRWEEFKRRYRAELKTQAEALKRLRALGKKRTVTLVYSAKDEVHNQAVALKGFLN